MTGVVPETPGYFDAHITRPMDGLYMLKHIHRGTHRVWCGLRDVIVHMTTEQLDTHVAELTRLLEQARALDVREALAEAKLGATLDPEVVAGLNRLGEVAS